MQCCSFKTLKQESTECTWTETQRQPRWREREEERLRERQRESSRGGSEEKEKLIPSLPPTTKLLSCHYSCGNIMGVGLLTAPLTEKRIIVARRGEAQPSLIGHQEAFDGPMRAFPSISRTVEQSSSHMQT